MCLKAADNHNPLNAEMYEKISGKQWHKVRKAPDWRLLEEYGGGLSREDYKKLKGKRVVPVVGVFLSPTARMWEHVREDEN